MNIRVKIKTDLELGECAMIGTDGSGVPMGILVHPQTGQLFTQPLKHLVCAEAEYILNPPNKGAPKA